MITNMVDIDRWLSLTQLGKIQVFWAYVAAFVHIEDLS